MNNTSSANTATNIVWLLGTFLALYLVVFYFFLPYCNVATVDNTSSLTQSRIIVAPSHPVDVQESDVRDTDILYEDTSFEQRLQELRISQ
jgi:hypothetical protein